MRARNGNGPLVVAMTAHAGDGDDAGLSECCRSGSMNHLKAHRDSITAEIVKRAGAGVQVRFAR